jgi:hypothetical protein
MLYRPSRLAADALASGDRAAECSMNNPSHSMLGHEHASCAFGRLRLMLRRSLNAATEERTQAVLTGTRDEPDETMSSRILPRPLTLP